MAELKTLTLNGVVYDSFAGAKGNDSKSAYCVTVTDYGAKGDGSTDDTAAFQAALAAERVVSVPGGTYKLSDTLVIRPNCCFELSQDTVLNYINTSGNCIEMRSSATLRGNHGIINVPYAFAGHVIDVVTTHDTVSDTEPYTHWTPMWKRGRYIYDISIVKANPSGLHYSTDGACSGTGIYMSGDGNNEVRFIWGALLQGIRIGGAFTRGIHAINFDLEGKEDSAWNHDMRIEAVLHGCETSVDLTNCNGVHLAVAVQPRIAENETKYAKWGVYLNDCRFVDMASSVIWDWNEQNTLYTSGSEYTAVAMYGKCWGLVYFDYCYHTHGTATRDRIYTDTPSNLEKMTIVQEPITRWFKQVEGVPYYFDGNADKKLATQEELDTYFDTDMVKGFTDVLATATDTDGTIYNGVGYKAGYRLNSDGSVITSPDNTYTLTGFMPIAVGQKMYVEGMSLASVDDTCRFCLYDSDKKIVQFVAGTKVATGTNYYIDYEETENGFWIMPNSVSNNNGTAYIRFNIFTRMVGERPMIAVDEEIKYTVEGFLADGIKVKGENVIGLPSSGNSGGGTSIDVTASPGQTIVVEEVDANGKPTKWKAEEYQERTHWSEFEETVLIDNQSYGEYDEVFLDFALVAGQSYHIVFNGVEYDEVARSGNMSGMVFVALGDGTMLEEESTGEPYTFVYMEGQGTMPMTNVGGDYTVSLSTTQETVHKMPDKYMPEFRPYTIYIAEDSDGYFTPTFVETVETALAEGREIKGTLSRNADDITLPLFLVAYSQDRKETEYGKQLFLSGLYLSGVVLVLTPQVGGTYSVTTLG